MTPPMGKAKKTQPDTGKLAFLRIAQRDDDDDDDELTLRPLSLWVLQLP